MSRRDPGCGAERLPGTVLALQCLCEQTRRIVSSALSTDEKRALVFSTVVAERTFRLMDDLGLPLQPWDATAVALKDLGGFERTLVRSLRQARRIAASTGN